MNLKYALGLLAVAILAVSRVAADDITTLDGQKYANVKYVTLKPNGLYFVITAADSTMKGVTVSYNNLPDDIKDKYHYSPFEMGMGQARQNQPVVLTTNLAFSLATLDAAKARAKAEKKLLGFIMVWDSFFSVPVHPMSRSSECALAQFYETFHDGMVLVFVHHETELNNVPDAVKTGFFGPDEGGFAPNMAVVTADCSQFVCEIPYGGKESNGAIRESIFREKLAVIKKFLKDQPPQ
jgi:hypothetical protein